MWLPNLVQGQRDNQAGRGHLARRLSEVFLCRKYLLTARFIISIHLFLANHCDKKKKTSSIPKRFLVVEWIRWPFFFFFFIFKRGDVQCRPMSCEPPKCKHPVLLPGECCPTCLSKLYFPRSRYISFDIKTLKRFTDFVTVEKSDLHFNTLTTYA